jgi:hypothetical protein
MNGMQTIKPLEQGKRSKQAVKASRIHERGASVWRATPVPPETLQLKQYIGSYDVLDTSRNGRGGMKTMHGMLTMRKD